MTLLRTMLLPFSACVRLLTATRSANVSLFFINTLFPLAKMSNLNQNNEAILDSFRCNICLQVLKDPVMINRCEHIYCRECIVNWLCNRQICPEDSTLVFFGDKTLMIRISGRWRQNGDV